jgi:hypothetical protein
MKLKLLNTPMMLLVGIIATASAVAMSLLAAFSSLKEDTIPVVSFFALASIFLIMSMVERSKLVNAVQQKVSASVQSHSTRAMMMALLGVVSLIGGSLVAGKLLWLLGAAVPLLSGLLALVEKTSCFVDADTLDGSAEHTAYIARVLKGEKSIQDPRRAEEARQALQAQRELEVLSLNNPNLANRKRASQEAPPPEKPKPQNKGRISLD